MRWGVGLVNERCLLQWTRPWTDVQRLTEALQLQNSGLDFFFFFLDYLARLRGHRTGPEPDNKPFRCVERALLVGASVSSSNQTVPGRLVPLIVLISSLQGYPSPG